jgi:hypothetical protein
MGIFKQGKSQPRMTGIKLETHVGPMVPVVIGNPRSIAHPAHVEPSPDPCPLIPDPCEPEAN